MNKYRVNNMTVKAESKNDKKAWWQGDAESAVAACQAVGWPPELCWVRQQTRNGGWGYPDDVPLLGVRDWNNLDDEQRKSLETAGFNFRLRHVGPLADEPQDLNDTSTGTVSGGVATLEPEVMTDEEKAKLDAIKTRSLDQMRPGDMSQEEKDAFEHRLHIMQLSLGAQSMFIEMGELLYNAREKAEWSSLHLESFKDYIEELKLPVQNSYSWASRLIGIYEYMIKQMKIDEKLLISIGVAKLCRLLPLARTGKLTQEMIEQAQLLSDMDLRAMLGHNVGGGSGEGDENSSIICSRCGQVLMGAKWVHGSPPVSGDVPGKDEKDPGGADAHGTVG